MNFADSVAISGCPPAGASAAAVTAEASSVSPSLTIRIPPDRARHRCAHQVILAVAGAVVDRSGVTDVPTAAEPGRSGPWEQIG